MEDIQTILESFTIFESHHFYREGNRAADYVASLGYSVPIHEDINPFLDNKYSFYLLLDKLGIGLVRRRS